jgi:hypothetical protein
MSSLFYARVVRVKSSENYWFRREIALIFFKPAGGVAVESLPYPIEVVEAARDSLVIG